jgi:uncharacterized 2Fe-2S/4Fe-4S cluster protein (DUF4445 family)
VDPRAEEPDEDPAMGRPRDMSEAARPRSADRTEGRFTEPLAGDALVAFMPSGRRGRFDRGTDVLDAARSLGVDLDSVCGGRGICGRCQIEISEGHHAKLGIDSRADHLTPFSAPEEEYRQRSGLDPSRRLGCHALILGDLVVDVPPESQLHRQVVRKEADERPMEVHPAVRLYYVEVDEPALSSPASDLTRLREALERDWSLAGLEVDGHVVREIHQALREGKLDDGSGRSGVTVIVHDGSTITETRAGLHDVALGIAFDIGSTTIAGHLCDLRSGETLASAGAMNPQIRFGEDLMSRVSYVMMHPGSQAELTAAVRACLADLTRQLCRGSGCEPRDVLEVTVVGNPIMHHLVLGLDPTPLGQAPFTLAADEALRSPATELDLPIASGARVYVLPCIAGHVGADAAGMILAEAPFQGDRVTLLVDVGTNAEAVLGNSKRLLACSSPTGPAFEGAQISSGQRAVPGAIERVRIDPETLEPRIRLVGGEVWSDEPSWAGSRPTGICGSGIIEAIAQMFLSGVVTSDGVIDGALAERSERVVPDGRTFAYVLHAGDPRIVVTQNDVRQIQLAKAALHAGCKLLMEAMGVDAVDRIRLAGAFGAQIDPVHALILGLIPDCDPKEVTSAGNAAGTGARMALLDVGARRQIEDVVRHVEKLETATEPMFQEHFVKAMAFPHASDPYERLGREVPLPGPRRPSGHRRERRGRRERSSA